MGRTLLAAVTLSAVLAAAPAFADSIYVEGYTRSDGTYVAPHYRSAPDRTPYNNWSTRGNVNPYTGQAGTRSPYPDLYRPYQSPRPSGVQR
ncbi:hypothetical protein [Roseospira visakhapatnamensis]|uniref:Opacity protein-like surface antigen n=1 Tax=Roseospira visakhapatnamensis TaxID=390880 RepID=A0A7W6RD64_9PROT|nr:hypothetical protein [Roseospira visakhapatnamensis]MBB4266287.1 opacity protein-like surface antigen [Roseospira visakhapatnamensis]